MKDLFGNHIVDFLMTRLICKHRCGAWRLVLYSPNCFPGYHSISMWNCFKPPINAKLYCKLVVNNKRTKKQIYTSSCKFSKLQHNYSLAFVAGLKRATDEGSLPEIAQYSPYYLPLNVFTASKGSNLYILFSLKIKLYCN